MKRTLQCLVTAGTVLLVLATPANAAESNWYMAVDFGYTRFNPTSNYPQPTGIAAVTSESGGGYRIGGGYVFNEYFSLEADYIDAGHTDVGPDAVLPKFGNPAKLIRTRGVLVDAIGSLPLGAHISIFARAGVLKATTERRLYNLNGTYSGYPDLTTHGTATGIGLGVAWHYDDNWTIRTQWQRYYGLGNTDIAVRGNLDIATLGVEYHY